MLLTEKYRPKDVKDIIGLDSGIVNLNLNNIPHLLFSGSPGTGKTTLAKVLIKQPNLDSLILNASDERGIDTVRDKIKVFASTKSSDGKYKIVFLDEADYLTAEAQTSLRNLMETYSSNCRFIFSCNYENKIIDPIKSRCVKLTFGNIKKEDILHRLTHICLSENIPFKQEALIKIIERTGNDVRAAINKIEELRNGVYLENIKDEIKVAQLIFESLKQKKFLEARQIYLDSHVDNEQFLKDLYQVIFDSQESKEFKKNTIFEIAECYKALNQVAWKEILVENLFLRLIEKC